MLINHWLPRPLALSLISLALQLPLSASLAMTCVQSASGELFSISKDSAKFHVHYSHDRGYTAVRQFEGPVAPQDIPMIQFQTESLKSLGSDFSFSLQVENCEFKKDAKAVGLCSADSKIEGTRLSVSSFSAFTTTQQHLSGDFKLQNFRMMIGDENVFFVTLSFPAQNCTGDL